MMNIKDATDSNSLLMLAPLAGFTDLPFRSVVKKFGVDISVSEMISSHALVYQSKKTYKMLEKSPLESPYAVQISGSKNEIIKECVEILNSIDGIDIIDFNCGCPAPKVSNHGNGSGLLKDLSKMVELLRLIRETSKKQFCSVKVRLGFDEKIPLDIAHAINDSGVDYCVVHARTRQDKYKRERIDYESLGKMKSILKVPMIANGDIDSRQKAKEVLEITGANGVMIGRAALCSPWIFWQIKNDTDELPKFLKRDLVLEHFDSMVDFYGEYGAVMFRKNLHAYAKGCPMASEYRNKINNLRDVSIIRESIVDFFGADELVSQIPDLVEFNKKSI